MTTTPTNQAVEAAVQRLMENVIEKLTTINPDVSFAQIEEALRAELSSPLEVAAPVGDMAELCRDLRIYNTGDEYESVDILMSRAADAIEALAASRVPVAFGAVGECENCNQLVRALREATEAPTFMGEPVIRLSQASGWLWTHIKSGGEYTMLGAATIQTASPLVDMAKVCVYQGNDGAMWVRPAAEFNERFKRTRPLPTPVPGGAGGDVGNQGDSVHLAVAESSRVQGALAQAVLDLNAAWNHKDHESVIAGHMDLCRRLALEPTVAVAAPLTLSNDDFWFLENAACTVEDAGKSGDQDADYSARQAARLRELKNALFNKHIATPAASVPAVGEVWYPDAKAFLEYWIHESHLQTFGDRERFRAAARHFIATQPPTPQDAVPTVAGEAEMVLVPREPTGEMWSVSRREFINFARKYEDAPTADRASIVADIAGPDIYRAMIAAAATPAVVQPTLGKVDEDARP